MNAMNRREFLGAGIVAGIEIAHPVLAHPRAMFPSVDTGLSSSGAPTARRMPRWLDEMPLVMAGCWDEFPLFARRVGGMPAWYPEIYREIQSEETVQKLKEIGVTLAIIPFFKGFGLEAEKPSIDRSRELTKRLKQAGIRVGVYVGSTIMFETFLVEKPEAKAWFAPDFQGKPLVYPGQPFRQRVYFMHPGYREYIKRVIRLAVEDLGVDLIHFDNTSLQARTEIFRHPLAISDFRAYLQKKYRPSELTERFGFSDLKFIVPPEIVEDPERIKDPLSQELADFRCHQLTEYYAEMSSYIHSLNPEVAVENNPSSGVSGRNMIWDQGVSYPQLLRQVNAVFTEEGDTAGVSPDGVLVSKIRTFKSAVPRNNVIFCYTYGSVGAWGYDWEPGGPLQMAESMAYNRQSVGMIGGFHDAPDLPAVERKYVRFFRDNFEYFRDAKPVADVALLYSYATMGFNNGRPQDSFMLASQMMIQNRLLFDIVFDDQLADLSRYPVLFLADQECLSDEQIQRIRDFVSNGGGLVATEQTSLYTEWRRRRKNFGLRELFGVDAPKWNGFHEPDSNLPGGPIRQNFGKGKIIYVPEITPSVKRPPNAAMTSPYWAPAANEKVLRDAVRWVIGDRPTVETGPGLSSYVTVELRHQQAKNRLLLHVLNYDHARTPSIRNIPVEVAIPNGHKLKRIQWLTPDRSGAGSLQWTGDSTVKFSLPVLEIYSIVVLDLE